MCISRQFFSPLPKSSMASSIVRLLCLLVLAFDPIKINPAVAVCPNANYKDTHGNGKCYRTMDTHKHEEAATTCRTDGATLPIVLSFDDNVAVDKAAGDMLPWLGLRCEADGSCTWEDGTAYNPATFNNFEGGRPKPSEGNCVALSATHINNKGNAWVSVSCERDIKRTVCELPREGGGDGGGGNPPNRCPQPYTIRYNEQCLYVAETARSYSAARLDCEAKNGQLLSLHSLAESDDIVTRIRARRPEVRSILLGAKLPESGGTPLDGDRNFAWADGTAFDFVPTFAPPFPSRRYGNCLRLVVGSGSENDEANGGSTNNNGDVSGQWQSTVCASPMIYVCRRMVPSTSAAGTCPTTSTGNYFKDAGMLQSPGYPAYHGDSLRCVYHISQALDRFVSITFEDFDLTPGDTLALYDGEEQGASQPQPFARFRANSPAYSLKGRTYTTVKSNLMRIEFTSGTTDRNAAEPKQTGWSIRYGAAQGRVRVTPSDEPAPLPNPPTKGGGGGGVDSGDGSGQSGGSGGSTDGGDGGKTGGKTKKKDDPRSGYPASPPDKCPPAHYTASTEWLKIASPGFARHQRYGNMLNCTYVIRVPAQVVASGGPTPVIELAFKEFGTEGCCDFVDLFDGDNVATGSRLTSKSLSGSSSSYEANLRSRHYTSNGPVMTVRFTSDSRNVEKGWGAVYRYVVADDSDKKKKK